MFMTNYAQRFYGSNGLELIETIFRSSDEFSIPRLLMGTKDDDTGFLISKQDANEVAQQVYAAPITAIEGGDGSLDIESASEADEVVPIMDKYFLDSDSICVSGGTIGVFKSVLEKDRLLDLGDVDATEAAIRIGGIYELGRFVSKKVYSKIMQNFHTSHLTVPTSRTEAEEFYEGFVEDLRERNVRGSEETPRVNDRAIEYYNRHIRPERFYSRGGLLTLAYAGTVLDSDLLVRELKQNLYRYYGGEQVASERNGDDGVDSVVITEQEPEQLPRLADIGAVTPIEMEQFDLLCSYIRKIEDDKTLQKIDSAEETKVVPLFRK